MNHALDHGGVVYHLVLAVSDQEDQRYRLSIKVGAGDARGDLVREVDERRIPWPHTPPVEVLDRRQVRDFLGMHVEALKNGVRNTEEGCREAIEELVEHYCEVLRLIDTAS